MAPALGFPFEFVSKPTFAYASDVRSCTSSRTLSPIGARSDKSSDDFEGGTATPPYRNTWSALQDKCRECDAGFPKVVDFAAIEPRMIEEKLLASNVTMPGPVKASMTMTPLAPAASKGSVGHPYTCGNACKYLRRKGGCHDGVDCTSCHLCHWSRDTKQQKEQKPLAQDGVPLRVAIPVSSGDVLEDDAPASIGSIGHPFSCKVACKYHSKKSGCKDGKNCSRCHLCHWRRCCERTKGNAESEATNLAALGNQDTDQEALEAFPKFDFANPKVVDVKRTLEGAVPMYVTISA